MTYLVVMVVVAAAGISWLWLQQRRERAHLSSVDGFRSSLERISRATPRGPRARARADSTTMGALRRTSRPPTRAPIPLDPVRREAARRRLEARRAARNRAAG